MENLSDGILLGCGNPLLDISASVDENFLKKYDLKPDDAILAENKHMALYDELIDKYKAEYIAGGSVQNTFRVCQWFLQRKNATVFFGCVGNDKYSKILEEKARTDGVNVQYQYTKEASTGTCGVLITGSHRSLCANLAAANHFTIEHLRQEQNRKLIESADYFYISGFFLTVSPPSIMEVAHYVCSHDRVFMMNLSAPFISQFYKEALINALPYVDILFGNEAEAESFAAANDWNKTDMKEIGKKLQQWPHINTQRHRIVVITQGKSAVLLFQQDTIEEFPVKALPIEEIVDTNGAGDAFVGGFLSQYIQKKPLANCVRCGIYAAREIIKRSGCTFTGQPDIDY